MRSITSPRDLQIGAVSRRSGVKIETIRYYERIGLMPEPDRSTGGNRIYDGENLKRLLFAKRCRGLGFSIGEIRDLLDMVDRPDATCAGVYQLTSNHLASVQAKIADLLRMERALSGMVDECSRGDIPDCPILDALSEEIPHSVAGP